MLCDAVTHWTCLEAVLHCRPALVKRVYIICPFVSTSYLVAVQAFPEAWPCLHLRACQWLKRFTNLTVAKAKTWWYIATNMTPRGALQTEQAKQWLNWKYQLWLALAPAVRSGTASGYAGQASLGPARRLHVLMAAEQKPELLSCRVGCFRRVSRQSLMQLSSTSLTNYLTVCIYIFMQTDPVLANGL